MKTAAPSVPPRRRRTRSTCARIVLLALGLSLIGRTWGGTPASPIHVQPNPTMKSFVIIFRQGPPALNPAELAQRQREVSAWVRENNTPERKLEPRILTPDVARPNGDDGVGDGAWPITAFLFIEAHDLDEAATIAASHPAKHFRARVEVRPWAPPAVPASSQPPR